MTIVTCVAGFALAATLSTSLTALTCSVRRRSDSMPLFVPRLKMDCGKIVRETVYMTDEDAGEYWRLSLARRTGTARSAFTRCARFPWFGNSKKGGSVGNGRITVPLRYVYVYGRNYITIRYVTVFAALYA